QVLFEWLQTWVEAKSHRVDGSRHAIAEPVQHVLDDRIDVDRQVRRQPYAPVLERIGTCAAGLVELDHRSPENRRNRRTRLAGLVDDVHLVGRHRLDDVYAAGDELGDLRRLLWDDADTYVL